VKSGARIIQQRSKVMLHSESSARVFGLRGTGFLSALGVVASIALAGPAFAQNPAAPPAAPAAPPGPASPAAGDTASADASFDRLISAELGRPGGLTSETAATRAKETSPALRKQREELRAAAADVDRALAAYFPRLSVEAQYTRLSDVGDSELGNLVAAPTAGPGPIPAGAPLVNVPLEFPQILNQYSVTANLVVPVSDYFLKVAPSHRAAKFARESTAQNLEIEKLDADAGARYAYYDWVRAKLGAIVADQALAQTQAHLNDLKALVDAGTASRADLLRVESQTAHAELVAVKSRHLSQLAEDHLRTLMHDPPNQGYVIGESFNAAPSADRQVPKLEELLRVAQAQRPEFRALEKAEQARRSEASAERGAYAPRLDLFAGATYANPNSRIFPSEEEWKATWQAGAKLSITLSDIPGTSARARSIDAKAASLVADRSVLADGVRTQVLQAAQAADEAEIALSTTERGLRAAEESYRVRKLLFANGRATTVEVLDAETDLTQARYDAVGARIDRGVARAQLARAVGQVGR
jgi:outer membrane protein